MILTLNRFLKTVRKENNIKIIDTKLLASEILKIKLPLTLTSKKKALIIDNSFSYLLYT